ncbi:MAG: SDR family oxidoreductase [Pirellulales bacterium]
MSVERPWALVTGASSGIGREFAVLLAERGYDLVLSARRGDRLNELAGELKQQHGANSRVITADLSTPRGPEKLMAAVEMANIPVEVLINNAGLGHYGEFIDQTVDQIDEVMTVNMRSATLLAHTFADRMKRQGGGHILWVGSFAGLQPVPRYAIYSATKTYAVALTYSLRYEFRKCGVKFSCLMPGFMETEFHEVSKHKKTKLMKWMTLDKTDVAKAGLKGMFGNKHVIIPGAFYKLNAWLGRVLPKRLVTALSAAVVKNKDHKPGEGPRLMREAA